MKGIVLLVDDEIDYGYILNPEGYFTVFYNNGEKAIDAIRGGLKYNLAIIDRSLKGHYNGDDVIMFSKILNKPAPVISMSGYSDKPEGADINIVKSDYSDKELIKAVNCWFPKDSNSK